MTIGISLRSLSF